MGLIFPKVSTGGTESDFSSRLLQTLLANMFTSAAQGAVNYGFQNAAEEARDQRAKENASALSEENRVNKLAESNERTIAPAVGPLAWAKMAKLNQSNPEMLTEATPDWEPGPRMPQDKKLQMGSQRVSPEPPAFLSAPGMIGRQGMDQLSGKTMRMSPSGAFLPVPGSGHTPILSKINPNFVGPGQPKQNVLSIASPLEAWANENPSAAAWASEPAAKRDLESKTFLAQLKNAMTIEDKNSQRSFLKEEKQKDRDAAMDREKTKAKAKKDAASAKGSGAGGLAPSKDPKFQALKAIYQSAESATKNPTNGMLDESRVPARDVARKAFIDYAMNTGVPPEEIAKSLLDSQPSAPSPSPQSLGSEAKTDKELGEILLKSGRSPDQAMIDRFRAEKKIPRK